MMAQMLLTGLKLVTFEINAEWGWVGSPNLGWTKTKEITFREENLAEGCK